ncbi:MAG: type 4a pilus biogenesis protein PilO [Candidatus Omnitrophica bacterium]|nr:type 4a pilus biogenesis protein PilO [Candidatus Omnitrophota bacterium]
MDMPAINLPNIQTKYKVIAALGIIALCLGYYYDHAYKPHAEKIEGLESELLTVEDTLKIIRTLEYSDTKTDPEILSNIKAKKNAVLMGIEKYESKLANKNQFSKILEQIALLSYDVGFDIKALEPKEFTLKQDYNSMSLNMEVNSQFQSLLDFLERLKEMPVFPESIYIEVSERPNLVIRLNLAILAR